MTTLDHLAAFAERTLDATLAPVAALPGLDGLSGSQLGRLHFARRETPMHVNGLKRRAAHLCEGCRRLQLPGYGHKDRRQTGKR